MILGVDNVPKGVLRKKRNQSGASGFAEDESAFSSRLVTCHQFADKDKGTYKHRSRQFLVCVTIRPNQLAVLSCGPPVDTEGIGIDPSQIKSGVFDGVYFHCSIEEHLGYLFKLMSGNVLYTWDPFHKTGFVNNHVTYQDIMNWLQDMIATCQRIFNTFSWGANYEKFCEFGGCI